MCLLYRRQSCCCGCIFTPCKRIWLEHQRSKRVLKSRRSKGRPYTKLHLCSIIAEPKQLSHNTITSYYLNSDGQAGTDGIFGPPYSWGEWGIVWMNSSIVDSWSVVMSRTHVSGTVRQWIGYVADSHRRSLECISDIFQFRIPTETHLKSARAYYLWILRAQQRLPDQWACIQRHICTLSWMDCNPCALYGN